MGGSVSKNQVPVSNANQVIISKIYPLSKLIMLDQDCFNFHMERKYTHPAIRKNYWIPSCCRLILTVLNECFHRK